MSEPVQPTKRTMHAPVSRCCVEGGCKRYQPFKFARTPDSRWLMITRYRDLGTGEVQVFERHDVTVQLDEILLQYRQWLDAQLVDAVKRANETKLILPNQTKGPLL
jgi:hypothetical protein